jgi:hypothetical protein
MVADRWVPVKQLHDSERALGLSGLAWVILMR